MIEERGCGNGHPLSQIRLYSPFEYATTPSRKRFVLLSFARIVSSAAVLSCGGGEKGPTGPVAPPAVASVEIVAPKTSIVIGEAISLVVTLKDAGGTILTGRAVTWSSSDQAKLSVNASGVATALAIGSVTVTATSESKNAQLLITVTQQPVAVIEISAPRTSILIGETIALVAVVKDAGGTVLTGRTVTWSTSDQLRLSVSATGLAAGVSAGSATVTATSEGKTAAITITVTATPSGGVTLDYSRELLGIAPTLSATVQSVNVATRTVVVQGVDTRGPSIPFTFTWGDGSVTNGFFPQSHFYPDGSRNYLARVTAHYSATETDSADLVARFVSPEIVTMPFPVAVTVTIPTTAPTLGSRQPGYVPPSNLQSFDNSFFSPSLPRSTVEYVLSQAANVEVGILENDVERVNGEWRQVVLRDPTFAGAYSIWYSTPIAFGAAASFFQGTPGYSSIFHEMGHNLSLNAPASFRYGGRIDGNANAIFSEAVAQMFQHSVAYEVVNNATRYGLPSDVAVEIANSARASAQVVRGFYDGYVAQGKPFATWNDPSTAVDETIGTFMTVARQFMIHAEQARSYVAPLTRTMRLLRTFNATLAAQYAQGTNSPEANVFRSTLMVAAVSYGFAQDLRAEFRALNFPIDDAIFASLYASVP